MSGTHPHLPHLRLVHIQRPEEEQNVLQERLFPYLRELCQQHGARFQLIDLRRGVSEEAGYDQQTMKICLGEIERCQKTSPRPNFIVLLGDRYGWRPLPAETSAQEFETIRCQLQINDKAIQAVNWHPTDRKLATQEKFEPTISD